MKARKHLTALCLLLLLNACASIHPGNMGESLQAEKDPIVRVSAELQSDASDERYTFVTFTIENKSESIVRVLQSDLLFEPSDIKGTNVLVGRDLSTWLESFQEEQQRKKHNRKIGQLAMVFGGALISAGGWLANSDSLKALGAGTMAGGAIWSIADSTSDSANLAEGGKKVPDTHIYAPFSVPAGKYLRRWVVIQVPQGFEIKKLRLKVELETHEEKTYAFEL